MEPSGGTLVEPWWNLPQGRPGSGLRPQSFQLLRKNICRFYFMFSLPRDIIQFWRKPQSSTTPFGFLEGQVRHHTPLVSFMENKQLITHPHALLTSLRGASTTLGYSAHACHNSPTLVEMNPDLNDVFQRSPKGPPIEIHTHIASAITAIVCVRIEPRGMDVRIITTVRNEYHTGVSLKQTPAPAALATLPEGGAWCFSK